MKRNLSKTLRDKVIERDGRVCQACGKTGLIKESEYGSKVFSSEILESLIQIDHILPRSRGGSTTFENLQVLCRPCNRRKSNNTMEEFSWRIHCEENLDDKAKEFSRLSGIGKKDIQYFFRGKNKVRAYEFFVHMIDIIKAGEGDV